MSSSERLPGRARTALRELPLAAALGALGTLLLLLQLFLGPDVGLADNGDGFRLMCEFELLKREDVLFQPLVVSYSPSSGCASHLQYFSSQQWLVAPAVEIYQLRYGAQAGLDLRALGLLHAGLFGGVLAAMFLSLPGGRLRRAVTVVAAAVLVADISFASYLVSPFSEPATFLGLLLVVSLAAWYVRTTDRAVVALVLLTAAGVFLALAKSQTFVFAVLLVPVLLLRSVPLGPLRGPWTGRIAPAVAAVVLVGASGGNLLLQPPFFTQVNLHNLTFQTLLPMADDPAALLAELQVPPGLSRYAGTGYFDAGAAGKLQDPEYAVFQAQVSRGDMVGYLARHPELWGPMLREGARASAVVRVDYLSNYREVRPPGNILAPRPDPARRLLSALGPASWPLLPLVWLVVAVGAAVVCLRRSARAEARSTAVVCYLLAAGALSQVVVALLGDGYYELVKHTVLAGYATALLVAVGLGAASSVLRQRLTAGRRSGTAAERATTQARPVAGR